jgi:CheY-like chemotaxis protein
VPTVRPDADQVRVVIVDDSDAFAFGISALLSRDDGVSVVGIGLSGAEGAALAHSRNADVVLMDALMPGMDGFEATAVIHRAKALRSVIILSTHTAEEMGEQAFAAGADGFLTKSHIEDHVSSKIADVVATARAVARAKRTSTRVHCHLCGATLRRGADFATLLDRSGAEIVVCTNEGRCDDRMASPAGTETDVDRFEARAGAARKRDDLRHRHCTGLLVRPLVG